MDKKVHRGEMDFFVHLDFVSMIFTDSYIGVVHLGEMDFFVHLSMMDFVVKKYPTFVTYMFANGYFSWRTRF
jgi:hypothetical protein